VIFSCVFKDLFCRSSLLTFTEEIIGSIDTLLLPAVEAERANVDFSGILDCVFWLPTGSSPVSPSD
jgi:hypothetical protein